MQYPFIKPRYYVSLFNDIFDFIKNPHNNINSEKSVRFKIYDSIGLIVVIMILLIPALLFTAFIYDPVNIQNISMTERFSPIVLLVLGGFILPLIEEVAFRLSLIFNSIYLSFSSSAIIYYFLTKAIFQTKISAIDNSFILRISMAIIFGFLIFLILNIKTVNEKVSKFWCIHFRSIYYFSCLIFACIHIYKYEFSWLNILLIPIITLPQLLSAIIYGYTRVSFGFKYPLILHMAMNTIIIGLSLLSSLI